MLQSVNLLTWQRWHQILAKWVPYLTLTISTVLGLLQPGQTRAMQIETAVWVVIAAAWVFFMYTRAPEPYGERRLRMMVYFVGLLLLGSVLMFRQPIFFVFTLTGFFHAAILRPWFLLVLGVAATSTLINTIPTGFPWPTIEAWSIFLSIIIIQTFAIGFGIVVSEKLFELSEQRRQAVAQLEAALIENAGLHAQLLAQAREAGTLDERQRLAREIHDTITQGLIGIITQLEAVGQATGRVNDQQRHLDNAARLARESLSEARRSVEAFRPQLLESTGLSDTLVETGQQWSVMNGIPLEVKTIGERLPLHPEIEMTLLRMVQEALANVVKHARASRAGVTLSYMGDVVTLDVRDDGVGFEMNNGLGPSTGFGLTAMRQRVSRVAGTLVVESEPGCGTAISARIPAIPAEQEVSE